MGTMINVAVFAGSCLGGVCVAHAGDSDTSAIKATSIAQSADINGQYDLADGRTLTISGSARKILAQLEGRPQTVLVPAGGAVFIAKDGSFKLTFTQHENGSISGVKLHQEPTAVLEHPPIVVDSPR